MDVGFSRSPSSVPRLPPGPECPRAGQAGGRGVTRCRHRKSQIKAWLRICKWPPHGKTQGAQGAWSLPGRTPSKAEVPPALPDPRRDFGLRGSWPLRHQLLEKTAQVTGKTEPPPFISRLLNPGVYFPATSNLRICAGGTEGPDEGQDGRGPLEAV